MIHCGGPGLVDSSTRNLPLRLFVAVTLMLVLGAGVVLADRKERKANKPKKGHAYHGVIQTIDSNAGTLTLALRKTRRHPEGRTKEFTIGQATRFVLFSAGDQKEELVGKAGLS